MLCLFYTESMCRFFKQRIFELSFEYFVTVCNTKNKKSFTYQENLFNLYS